MLQDRTEQMQLQLQMHLNESKNIFSLISTDQRKKFLVKNLKLIGNLNYLFHSHKKASKKLFSVNFW